MNITAEEIEKNRNNPEKLKHIVDLLTQSIELDERKQVTTKKLRWELTRQMHNKMTTFWIDDEVTGNMGLVKLFNKWNAEYEIVFGKQSPYIYGNFIQDAIDWKWRQKENWEKAQKELITAV